METLIKCNYLSSIKKKKLYKEKHCIFTVCLLFWLLQTPEVSFRKCETSRTHCSAHSLTAGWGSRLDKEVVDLLVC